jgi:uncharacterized membrane protein
MHRLTLEYFTLAVLMSFGFLYALVIPPFGNPDESSHFFRVYAIASGDVFPANDAGVPYQNIPRSLSAFTARVQASLGKPHTKYTFFQWYVDSHERMPPSEDSVPAQFSAVRMTPTQYIPHVVGYWVGSILYVPFPGLYNWTARILMARLGGLVFAALAAFWVLRRSPTLRYATSATILLPMPVMLAAAVTADTVLITACLVYAATLVRVHVNGYRDNTDTYALLTAAFLIGNIKLVYVPLLAAVLLLKTRLPARDFAVLTTQACLVAIAGLALSATLFSPVATVHESVGEQVQYLLNRPGEILRLPVRSLVVYREYYANSMLMNFGSLDTSVPFTVIVLLAWLYPSLVIADCCWGSGVQPTFRCTAAIATGITAAVYALFLLTYCHWTTLTHGVGWKYVEGVQGRYFLPLLPFAAIAACYFRFGHTPVATAAKVSGVCGLALIHVVCLLTIVGRFWIPS